MAAPYCNICEVGEVDGALHSVVAGYILCAECTSRPKLMRAWREGVERKTATAAAAEAKVTPGE